jgi:hypothetical protein
MMTFQPSEILSDYFIRHLHDLAKRPLKVMPVHAYPPANTTCCYQLDDIKVRVGDDREVTDVRVEQVYSWWRRLLRLAPRDGAPFAYRIYMTLPVWKNYKNKRVGPIWATVLYDDSDDGGPVLGWWPESHPLTLNHGDTYTITHPDNLFMRGSADRNTKIRRS